MFGIDPVIDIEKLILSRRHSTGISETIDECNTDDRYRTRRSSKRQYSHHDKRSTRECESDNTDSLYPDFLTELTCHLLENDSGDSDNSEKYIAPSLFDVIEECQEKARSECIPKSKDENKGDCPENIDVDRLMGEYFPNNFEFFF